MGLADRLGDQASIAQPDAEQAESARSQTLKQAMRIAELQGEDSADRNRTLFGTLSAAIARRIRQSRIPSGLGVIATRPSTRSGVQYRSGPNLQGREQQAAGLLVAPFPSPSLATRRRSSFAAA